MGEFVGLEHARSGPGHIAGDHDPAPTPEQVAHTSVGSVTWRVDHVVRAKAALEAASAANDVAEWRQAKHVLDRALVEATQTLERNADRVAAASTADLAALEHAKATLVSAERVVRDAHPPLGYVEVAAEDTLLAFARRADGAEPAAFDTELGPILEATSIADLRILRDRIARHRPNDHVADAIWNLGVARRDHVSELIVREDRAKARVRATGARASRIPTPPAPSQTRDDLLIGALDSFAPEAALFTVLQPLATTARHTLASRCSEYRPGNGDAFAARFAALPSGVKQRLLAFLEGTFAPLQVAIDAEIADSLGPKHDLVDRFDAAVKRVGPDYSYEPAVERKSEKAAAGYLRLNNNNAWLGIEQYLADVRWPPLGAGVQWSSERTFSARLIHALHASMPALTHEPLVAVLYPYDPFRLIDALRPDHDRADWISAIGFALGQLVQRVAAGSLGRVAARLAIAASDDHDGLEQGAIPLSHPMDGFVFEAMRKPGAVHITANHQVHAETPRRPVQLVWQGSKDPATWNWVRAEPRDATVEEVVAQVARETGRSDLFAAALAVAPPLFGFPTAWARTIPEAVAHMPRALAPQSFDARVDTQEARLLELSRHTMPEAEAQSYASATVVRKDVADQLESLHSILVGWGFGSLATEAIDYLDRHVDQQTSGLDGQKARLSKLGNAIAKLDGEYLAGARTSPRKQSPLRAIVQQFASAVAASRNATICDALYAKAMEAQAELAIDAMQAQILDVASLRSGHAETPSASRIASKADDAIANARLTQDRLINGGDVGGTELFDATLATREVALRSRLDSMFFEVGQLQVSASEADEGFSGWLASLASHEFRTLGDVVKALRLTLDRVTYAWTRSLTVKTQDGSEQESTDAATHRDALAIAEREFARIRTNAPIMELLVKAPTLVRHQQLRRTFINIGALVAVAVATMGASVAVEASVGAAMMSVEGAEAIGELSSFARVFTKTTGVVTELAANSIGQSAMTGTRVGEAAADNVLFMAGGLLFGQLGKELGELRAAARELEVAADKAVAADLQVAALESTRGQALSALGWVARKSALVTGETITNIAMANVGARLRGEPGITAFAASDLFVQALSVAVGHSVHAGLAARRESLERLAKLQDATPTERKLLADAKNLDELALAMAQGRAARLEYAHALYSEQTRLLDGLREAVDVRIAAHEGGSAAHDEHALISQTKSAVRSDALVAMRMSLIGLEELVPGRAWKGTEAEFDRASTELSRSHVVTKSHDAARDISLLTVDDRIFEIHVREPEARVAAPRRTTHELSTDLEMVPGSSLRGSLPGSQPDKTKMAAVRARANEAMLEIAREADVNGITVRPDHKGFIVELRTGGLTVVDVDVVRLPDFDVARLIPNSSHDNVFNGRTTHGAHTIQLSADLPADQIERALAHAVARLGETHVQAQHGSYADGPRGHAWSTAPLCRIAELRFLARQVTAHPGSAPTIRRELVALADHLGVVGDAPAARERRAQLETRLTAGERDALEHASRASTGELTSVREAARTDIAADLERERQRGNDRPAQYELAPGRRMGREDLARFAASAARLRALESAHTLQILRARAAEAARTPSKYLKIQDVQIGGRAALSARTPTSPSVDIAQTGQQLQELYKAKFGDVRQVAEPNQRVPLDAIQFWEDSIAAMGPVIDGTATPRLEGNRMLLDITPADGEMLTIEVGGTPVMATGFAAEAVPGAPRMNMVDVMTTLEEGLRKVEMSSDTSPNIRDAAAVARRRLAAIDRPRETQGAVDDALNVPYRAELETKLRAANEPAAKKVENALLVVKAGKDWATFVAHESADGVFRVAFGDEANLDVRVATMLEGLEQRLGDKPIRFVFAGAGGTAVSAASIVLSRRNTEVMMIGRDTPTGLTDNPQFRELVALHGDSALAGVFNLPPGDSRLKMYLEEGLAFSIPESSTPDVNGRQTIEAYKAKAHEGEFRGDAYVVSAGRTPQTPPEVSDMIIQVTRAGGTVGYRIDLDADDQFTGYTVLLTPKRGTTKEIAITGAASRYLPFDTLKEQATTPKEVAALAKFARASSRGGIQSSDVPPASGGFPGGFTGSSVQGYRQSARANGIKHNANQK
ncbi:hypothetical protein BH11MYX1_BH11MYX1_17000 [soil metagenome]